MQNSEKLSITLPAEMVRIIRQKVESGGYGSNSEVIREAMRGWLDKEERLHYLDSALMQGINSIKAGNICDIDELRAEMKKRFSQ